MTMPRQTAAERRVAVLDAATTEFAAKGLHGASTEDIARAAGISQPYLFRLFGTKKELYLATSQRAIEHLYQVFADAAAGKRGWTHCTRWGRRTRTSCPIATD